MLICPEGCKFHDKDGKMVLKIEHVFPPIPDRRYDYCAYVDGDEEKREYGWGPTAEDALKDWRDNYAEEYERGAGGGR